MPHAKPSTRAVGQVDIVCGMINIPVRLYAARDSAGLERHRWITIDGTDRPVGNGWTDKTTGELLDEEQRESVESKVETEYGPVFVTDDEIEELLNLDHNTLTIQSFQPIALRDSYSEKGVNHVEPAKVKVGKRNEYMKNATRALATLYEAMNNQNVMALCELTTRGVPKPCLLLPDGRLLMLYHTEEIRAQREMPETEIRANDLTMMDSLVEALLEVEPTDLEDRRSALIQAFANEKAEKGEFGKPDEEEQEKPEPQDIEDDFAAALRKSIEDAKKGKSAKKKARTA